MSSITESDLKKLQDALLTAALVPDAEDLDLITEIICIKKKQEQVDQKLDTILNILVGHEKQIGDFLSENRMLYVSNLNAILERGISTELTLNKIIADRSQLSGILMNLNKTQQNIAELLQKLNENS